MHELSAGGAPHISLPKRPRSADRLPSHGAPDTAAVSLFIAMATVASETVATRPIVAFETEKRGACQVLRRVLSKHCALAQLVEISLYRFELLLWLGPCVQKYYTLAKT